MRKLTKPRNWCFVTEQSHWRWMTASDKRHAKRAAKQWYNRIIKNEYEQYQHAEEQEYLKWMEQQEEDAYMLYQDYQHYDPYADLEYYDDGDYDDYYNHHQDDDFGSPYADEDDDYPYYPSEVPDRGTTVDRLMDENRELYKKIFFLQDQIAMLKYQQRMQQEPL